MQIKTIGLAASIGTALTLSACGDEVTEVTKSHQNSIYVFDESGKFPSCEKSGKGSLYFRDGIHFCDGDQWFTLDGENGSDGNDGLAGKNGLDGSYCETQAIDDGYKILCDGDSVGIIKHGLKGVDGTNGSNGDNGTACVTDSTASGFEIFCNEEFFSKITNGEMGIQGDIGEKGDDGSFCITQATADGFEIFCDGTSIGKISNGNDGLRGDKGESGDNGTACIAKASEAGYNIICNGTVVGQILNGNKGATGEQGTSGEKGVAGDKGDTGDKGVSGDDGHYCTTSANSTGYSLVCTGEAVGAISNGTEGETGDKGETATGCSFTENDDGSYTQTCGTKTSIIYAAVCGTTSYNPEGNKFCFGVKLYDKCGSSEYNPTTEFCSGSEIINLCGGKSYDTSTEACCNETVYTSATQFCSSNTVYNKCGTVTYTPSTQFCSSSKVYNKCGISTYDPAAKFCSGTTLYNLCGGKTYTPSTQACCNATVYTSATQFCSSNTVYNKCGTATYTPSTQFCSSSKVYNKCGTSTYDPAAKFCSGTTLYNLCGGKTYTPSTEFCSGSIVLTSKVTCPSGKTCKHAPTTQLNTNIKYGEILDTRDNQIYNTVKIGTQVWMAQNLNYASTTSQCYKGIADNCNKYGRIYTWNEAMGSDAYSYGGSDQNRQGLCPSGWRIPTRSDWQTLTSYAGGTILDKNNQWGSYKIAANSAYNLQSLQSWSKSKATDKYGFSIIQGGYRWDNGDYTAGSPYWTSTYCNTSRICRWGFWDGSSEPDLWYDYKTYRFSVRCIKK